MTEPDQPTPQPGPVVKVARDLTEIVALAAKLPKQIVHKPNDRLMPGGTAMVALAGDADLDEWSEHIAAAEFRHFAGCDKASHKDCTVSGAEHVHDEDDQADEDPLRTLLWWSEERRERYGYPLEGRRPTFETEAKFLRWALDAMWRDEPRWEDFADDVNRARRRLEDMLSAGQRQQRTRVPCNRKLCTKKPRLVKVHAPRKQVGVQCVSCGALADMTERERCPVCWTHAPAAPLWASDEEEDRHKCPSCKHWFDADDYQRAYADHLRSKGAERFVPITEAIKLLGEHGRSKHTVRKWLAAEENPPTTAWEFPTWRRMVWWPDLWTKHLTTATRKRDAA